MFNQEEYGSGSFRSFPMSKSYSCDMLNARAQSFLPRSDSATSLNSMGSGQAMNGMSRTNSASSLHDMGPGPGQLHDMSLGLQPNGMSRISSSSSIHGMPFSHYLGSINCASSLQGMPFLQRRNSASSLHGMSSSVPLQSGLHKTSFLIPNPPGPPTLVHVFNTGPPTPNSPMFVGGNFPQHPFSPQPMSPVTPLSGPPHAFGGRKSFLLDEGSRRVLHQVEFYFSDLNVATTDHLIRYTMKDPEGYVPIAVIASFKKIRTSISNTSQLADILRHSDKLIVSDDGKKVKRVDHVTESYLEELQSRIVVAENLPEDHCHQSLMLIFLDVGSVKGIRTCMPSASSGGASSAPRTEVVDGLFHSNKLHAFVEYEEVDMAEKAVAELNDVDQVNGLKVHPLIKLKPQVKSSPPRSLGASHCNNISGLSADSDEFEGYDDFDQKKLCGLGSGKGRERPQYLPPSSRVRAIGSSQSTPNLATLLNNENHASLKQTLVPRMPDGTRGFSMGRGKVIVARGVGV